MNHSDLLSKLKPHGQEHLLAFWDRLAPIQQGRLADEIRQIDFGQLAELFANRKAADDWVALARRADRPGAFRLAGKNGFGSDQARQAGNEALQKGEVGVVLVAGGQGTRLGFDRPKGMYPIGPVSGATLFEILFQKLLAVRRRHKADIPLYLMTSPETDAATRGYLAARDWFQLPERDVAVFCQGTMPAVDAASGKVLLADPDRVFLNPDGHGGMPAALGACGGLEQLRARGVRQIFYLQVDNPLVAMCDPAFIGYHRLAGSELSTQVVAKRTPLDRLGNVVAVDGRLRIIEYSDLPPEAAARRSADGSLSFWAGSIAVHVFELALLERMTAAGSGLPFHTAHKAVPYVGPDGRRVEPREPNAIKFERFIFDLLPHAARAIAVEVDEASAFAPLKNAPGASRDSPELVRAQMAALHAGWLRAAGATVEPDVPVEISPLRALAASDLSGTVPLPLAVQAPSYFR